MAQQPAPAQSQQQQNQGFMGNAMDMIFGSGRNQQQPNPNNVNPGNPAQPYGTAAPGSAQNDVNNPSNPNAAKTGQDQNGNLPTGQQGPKGDESPLAEFADLWDTPKDKDGNPVVKKDEPVVAFDETKFNEILGKVDFTKGIDQELMQKALGGDQSSLLQIMNQVGKSSLGMSTKLTRNLVESAVTKQVEQLRTEMGEQFRSHSTRNSLSEDNPALNHPAMKPLVSSLESQIRAKYPEATPQELTAHAKRALVGMAEAIVGKDKSNNNSGNSGSKGNNRTVNGTDDVDWGAFAAGETNDMSKI